MERKVTFAEIVPEFTELKTERRFRQGEPAKKSPAWAKPIFTLHVCLQQEESGTYQVPTTRLTIDSAMVKEAVAAGDGALQTLITLSDSAIKKSSTNAPLEATA